MSSESSLTNVFLVKVRVANIGRSSAFSAIRRDKSIELGFRMGSEVYQQRSLAALSRIDDKSLELHFVEKRHRFARMPAANKDGSFVAK